MKQGYRRWACGLLAGLLALLTLCAATVYTVDPCLYYRLPTGRQSVFFSERYQSAGLLKHVPADTVLLGTSMAANYRAGDIAAAFGGTALRITLPDGYLSEFDRAMGLLFREQNPQRVIFGLDVNILVRDESGLTAAMPEYLYNETPLDDIKYLLNKDALYDSVYALLADHWGEGQTLDEGFTWDGDIWWNHITALSEYQRPEIAAEELPPDAYEAQTAENLRVIVSWLEAHPETEFDVFFPPYSILYWDKTLRQGHADAVLAALDQTCRTLLAYDNVKLYAPLLDRDIVENLDHYCDYVHHSGEVCGTVLEKMAAGEDALTAENVEETLANWRDFVVHYDYEKFWEESFWVQWNAAHPAA